MYNSVRRATDHSGSLPICLERFAWHSPVNPGQVSPGFCQQVLHDWCVHQGVMLLWVATATFIGNRCLPMD